MHARNFVLKLNRNNLGHDKKQLRSAKEKNYTYFIIFRKAAVHIYKEVLLYFFYTLRHYGIWNCGTFPKNDFIMKNSLMVGHKPIY